jgi:hypothetical protein
LPRPELKQFGELLPADFDRHPVWIQCHVADYGEPWYEETDEDTVRPWTGGLPVSPADDMFLVRATFEMADGSRYPGFVTPALEEGDLGILQPHIFVGPCCFAFWGGMLGILAADREALYAALKKSAERIFPLQFSAAPHLATGIVTGHVNGFYRSNNNGVFVEF